MGDNTNGEEIVFRILIEEKKLRKNTNINFSIYSVAEAACSGWGWFNAMNAFSFSSM